VNRWNDWWEQALRDVQHARHALDDADYEWSAFAAQQGAEKAHKALVIAKDGKPRGHSITALVEALPQAATAPDEVLDAAKRLDKHYIPSREPNGFDSGFPGKLYTRGEAKKAIEDAREIVDFNRRHLPG